MIAKLYPQTEAGGPHSGLKSFVDVYRAKRSRRDDQDRGDGRQQGYHRRIAGRGVEKDVIEEGAQHGADSACRHEVGASPYALADRATHHIDDSKNDIGDDERECQADAPTPICVASKPGMTAVSQAFSKSQKPLITTKT